MTVEELIEKLKEMPQDAQVELESDGSIWFPLGITYERGRVIISGDEE